MPGWPRFVVIVRDDAIAVKTEEGSRIAADELPNCRSTGQIGFLIFRLFMIVYYFAPDCTQVCITPLCGSRLIPFVQLS